MVHNRMILCTITRGDVYYYSVNRCFMVKSIAKPATPSMEVSRLDHSPRNLDIFRETEELEPDDALPVDGPPKDIENQGSLQADCVFENLIVERLVVPASPTCSSHSVITVGKSCCESPLKIYESAALRLLYLLLVNTLVFLAVILWPKNTHEHMITSYTGVSTITRTSTHYKV